MSFISRFKTLDSKFSWSFFGFIIGLLGILYAIYVDQFKINDPSIVFDILSNTQVLSVKEDVNRLEVIYNGQNLKEKQENLILLTIRISNEGKKDIAEQDYYSKIPFGFRIDGGKIADKAILIEASNLFLKRNLKILNDSENNIIINNIPLDKGQFFVIKLLTICRGNIFPSIIPSGKISGISGDFIVRKSYKEVQKENVSFLTLLLNGNFGIHIARFFFYLFCIIAFSLLIGIPASKISDFFETKRKKNVIQRFREKAKIKLTTNTEILFEIYMSDGSEIIKWLNRTINNQFRLKNAVLDRETQKAAERFVDYHIAGADREELFYMRTKHISLRKKAIISDLVDKKIITIKGNEYKVDKQFINEVHEFNYFLEYQ